jgi:hypothetical protein
MAGSVKAAVGRFLKCESERNRAGRRASFVDVGLEHFVSNQWEYIPFYGRDCLSGAVWAQRHRHGASSRRASSAGLSSRKRSIASRSRQYLGRAWRATAIVLVLSPSARAATRDGADESELGRHQTPCLGLSLKVCIPAVGFGMG